MLSPNSHNHLLFCCNAFKQEVCNRYSKQIQTNIKFVLERLTNSQRNTEQYWCVSTRGFVNHKSISPRCFMFFTQMIHILQTEEVCFLTRRFGDPECAGPCLPGAHGCEFRMQVPPEDAFASEAAVWRSAILGLEQLNHSICVPARLGVHWKLMNFHACLQGSRSLKNCSQGTGKPPTKRPRKRFLTDLCEKLFLQ